MEVFEEVDDQAALVGSLTGLHLRNHGGKPDPNCEFCKGFIIRDPNAPAHPLMSYKFVLLDVSNNENGPRISEA